MLTISLPRINSWLTLSCLVGLGLSLYAYAVELQVEMDENYEAMCDINAHVSCTKAFKSEINSWLSRSCLVGLGLSLYSYMVEFQVEMDENYQAMCDINSHVSCSKALTSDYGKGFGIFGKDSVMYKPNSLFGLMFYSMIATLAQSNARFIVLFSFVAIALSNLLSLYFAYILYFILYDLCIVCVSIYVVNVINLILIQLKIKALKAIEEDKNK